MKKSQPPEEPAAPGSTDPATSALRPAFAPAEPRVGSDRQAFVITTLPRTLADTLRAQNPERESPQDDVTQRGPSPPAWEESSGEGAASALESLRKLEQSRRTNRPAEERPGAE